MCRGVTSWVTAPSLMVKLCWTDGGGFDVTKPPRRAALGTSAWNRSFSQHGTVSGSLGPPYALTQNEQLGLARHSAQQLASFSASVLPVQTVILTSPPWKSWSVVTLHELVVAEAAAATARAAASMPGAIHFGFAAVAFFATFLRGGAAASS